MAGVRIHECMCVLCGTTMPEKDMYPCLVHDDVFLCEDCVCPYCEDEEAEGEPDDDAT